MRRLALFLLPLCLVACKKEEPPDARQAAVNVEVTFNFKAGCIVVAAADAADLANPERRPLPVFEREAANRKVNVAVFRKESWSRKLKVTTSALEANCDGPVVATKESDVSLEAAGVQTLAVTLTATDEDGDGYVPTAGGGTDCDDTRVGVVQRTFYKDEDGDGVGGADTKAACTVPAGYVALDGDCDEKNSSVNPNATEVCNDVDDNCDERVDEGYDKTWYRDTDGDGFVVDNDQKASCTQPAGYARKSAAFDCDDSKSAVQPGAAEVCNDIDDNCVGGVDEGYDKTWYRDADGDGFVVENDQKASCVQPAGYARKSAVFDCDDSKSAVKPGATEVCNDIDDNCVGGVDEGYDKAWYRDVDGDGFGIESDQRTSCVQPAGYVRRTDIFDCDDTKSAVKPGAPELCNEIDDNCVGGIDELFTDGPRKKGDPCDEPCRGGTYQCLGDGSATYCNAPQPANYHPDLDGDGAGDDSATAEPVCPDVTPPVGKVANRDDCNDQDKYNRRNGTEVCDDRDNNCDGNADEGGICGGVSWKVLADAAVTGNTRDWNTVAVNQGSADGYPVWVAGDRGVLARRLSATTPFTNFDTKCSNYNWKSAWVRPSDGHVFLAGSGGQVAEFDGTTCTNQNAVAATADDANGIIGFETGSPPSTRLFIANDGGRLYSWTPPSAPVEIENASYRYKDVHGLDATRLFIAAQDDGSSNRPFIRTYTGGTTTSDMGLGSIGNNNNTSIRGVWMVSPTLAYAVGDGSALLRWTGGTDWTVLTSPSAVANFTSVCAPDPASVYTVERLGVIRRYTGLGNTWVTHYSALGELRDIALVSPTNVWAVGVDGRVVHFPEP